MSTSTPPSGRSTSSRAVVVWRPRWSVARTSPVACTSAPTSAFTSVDFPTPDAPISATVRPVAGVGAQLVDAGARDGARDDHGRADGGALDRSDIGARSRSGFASARSAFVEHDDRVGAALEREHQLAFEPPEVRTVLERLRDEHGVDVGRDDLRVPRRPVHGIAAHERRMAREDRDDVGPLLARRRAAPSRRWRAIRRRSRRAPCRRR